MGKVVDFSWLALVKVRQAVAKLSDAAFLSGKSDLPHKGFEESATPSMAPMNAIASTFHKIPQHQPHLR